MPKQHSTEHCGARCCFAFGPLVMSAAVREERRGERRGREGQFFVNSTRYKKSVQQDVRVWFVRTAHCVCPLTQASDCGDCIVCSITAFSGGRLHILSYIVGMLHISPDPKYVAKQRK